MKILIVEDEGRIARRLERMTRQFFTDTLEALHVCESLEEGQAYLTTHTFDLVLLDLNLNGADGFELLKVVVAESFHTIIVSAYKDKAITAFEYGVLDFVPKPFSEDRLNQAFLRVSAREKVITMGVRFLAVKKKGNSILIDVQDISYIKGSGIYSELHLKNGKKEIHDKSLERLEQLLPQTFERIHKSYLVETSQIKEIIVQSGSSYKVLLTNGELLPVGRTRYKILRTKLFGEE
ncbi:LytTR family DNA-binding domain-containing protein [Cytophagaceae bacterium DM2B3-1]|uniref:LytTR family DNA-binding domain-containing protein n=1 Tax=Xanthocytophaga flava TaxID=3048013 RepID=A0ABT7CL76_9BACT|nr:LytTR family DNA-binding domain-containing protein [Xanthocytophaga flavus]MDJ1494504.1 LytTR family DNA-binding domain-containing protein [Xanthocytophaga flavus]